MSRKRMAIPLVVVLVAAGAAAWWWSRRPEPAGGLTASGTVEATEARLGFDLGGRLAAVGPREGDEVAAGDELAVLDRRQAEAARREAEARLAAAEARLAELTAGFRDEEVAGARAAAAAARRRLADAELDLERTRTLLAGGAVSREALDKAELGRDLAADELAQAGERLRLLERGPRAEQVAAARAEVERARAGLAAVEVTLDDLTLVAPFAGLVTARHREPGEVATPGAPVVTLLDRGDRWVRIYIPEDRVGAVRLGGAATIRSDTYPDKGYPGRVVHVASQAEFTPKSVQTPEERVRLVYAVKVQVVDDPGYELKPGMPADVTLETGDGAGAGGGA